MNKASTNEKMKFKISSWDILPSTDHCGKLRKPSGENKYRKGRCVASSDALLRRKMYFLFAK